MKIKQISVSEYASKIDPIYFRENRKNPNARITQQAIKYRIKNTNVISSITTTVKRTA